jgi:Ca2+-binding EF-hand superfamily protein
MMLRLAPSTILAMLLVAGPVYAQQPSAPPAAATDQEDGMPMDGGFADEFGAMSDGDTADDMSDDDTDAQKEAQPGTQTGQQQRPQQLQDTQKPRRERAARPAAGNRAERAERLFKRMDKNNDGFVETSEMEAQRLRRFNRVDRNRDGSLDAQELERARVQQSERKERRAAQRGTEVKERAASRDPFVRVDSNKDGIITRDEWLERPRRAMQQVDRDKDGKVSEDEMNAALQRRAAR